MRVCLVVVDGDIMSAPLPSPPTCSLGLMPDSAAFSFMPTFAAAPDTGLDVLGAAAALSHTQPAHTAVTQATAVRTAVPNTAANTEQITIPGLAAIPLKLVKKIWDFQFVDLTELLPETLHLEEVQGDSCCRPHAQNEPSSLTAQYGRSTTGC